MRLPRQNYRFRKSRDRGNVLTATNFCVEISDRARAATARVPKDTAGENRSEWRERRDSNPRPTALQAGVLTS